MLTYSSYIGLNDGILPATPGYHWEADGTPVLPGDFIPWGPGEPSGFEPCVAINSIKNVWVDYICNNKLCFLCQLPFEGVRNDFRHNFADRGLTCCASGVYILAKRMQVNRTR